MAKVGRMHRIIVDTNFLIDIVRFKIEMESIRELLLGSYNLVIPKAVEDELRRMKSNHAKAAIKLAKLRGVKTIKNPAGIKGADNIIVAIAEELYNKKVKIAVATNDAKLRKRLKALGVKTIYLRKRKHLAIS